MRFGKAAASCARELQGLLAQACFKLRGTQRRDKRKLNKSTTSPYVHVSGEHFFAAPKH